MQRFIRTKLSRRYNFTTGRMTLTFCVTNAAVTTSAQPLGYRHH